MVNGLNIKGEVSGCVLQSYLCFGPKFQSTLVQLYHDSCSVAGAGGWQHILVHQLEMDEVLIPNSLPLPACCSALAKTLGFLAVLKTGK